ncbi:hypothetical protein CEW81_20370 [Kluyvera genomosp. 3]|uniref:Uncharacterized protein n=1 Tax=Kluyvera genomosp. 3 TaxID=2774055 RepID=A0A248KJW7_9ENTR|nr:hypothetical protein CEW81_20370 [Kluyvera genomosp. 3]
MNERFPGFVFPAFVIMVSFQSFPAIGSDSRLFKKTTACVGINFGGKVDAGNIGVIQRGAVIIRAPSANVGCISLFF